MNDAKFFAYQKVAREAGLTDDQLNQLAQVIRADYPNDEMLYELHMLRACRAIRDRDISFDEALANDSRRIIEQR
jgi:hypothetical protein